MIIEDVLSQSSILAVKLFTQASSQEKLNCLNSQKKPNDAK